MSCVGVIRKIDDIPELKEREIQIELMKSV